MFYKDELNANPELGLKAKENRIIMFYKDELNANPELGVGFLF